MRKSSSDPIGTLSVGNVVSAGVTLYKSNFRDYFWASLRAVGWLFLGLLGIAPIVFLPGLLNNLVVTVLVIIAWIGFLCFCLGKAAVNRAIISRLAYQQLANRPETIAEATRQLAPQHWKFLRLSLWLALFLIGVFLLSYLVLIVLGGIGVFLMTQGGVGSLVGGLLILAGIVAFLWLIIRFYSYWFVAELPLAVEDRIEPLDSIGRSRQLATPFIVRIQIIIFVAFLITLPLSLLANAPTLASYGIIMDQVRQSGSNPEALASMGQDGSSAMLQIASMVLGFLLELFLVPFWQAIKSVVYFDLRSRREGADLQMR